MPSALHTHRILAVLLPQWEALTAPVSTDRHVRLQRLLQVLPTDVPDVTLRNVLCAVLVTSEADQTLFLDLFEQLNVDFEVPKLEKTPKKTDEPKPPSFEEPAKPDSPEKPLSTPNPNKGSGSLILDYENASKPPVSWNIAITPDQKRPLDAGAGFRRTVLQLRQREYAQNRELDLTATVAATIRQLGMPQFRYRQRTRPAEYLLLVERFSSNDHRAALFDALYQNLKNNEVLTERFFYDGDLRLCRNEQYPEGLYLHELNYRYPDVRLLVLGSGYRLISPATGQLIEAAKTLQRWHTRLLLTPVVRSKWGSRERLLTKVFTLLPAAVESLQFAAESHEGSITTYDRLPKYLRDIAETEPIEIQGNTMRHLRRHFDTAQLRWIAACAIYPGLYYNLTLDIGDVVAKNFKYPIVNTENLLKMARLPWFTQGKIPKEVRKELIDYLKQQSPQLYREVLQHLTVLMEKKENRPPPESIAWAEHRINLALWKAQSGQHVDPAELEEIREYLTVKRVGQLGVLDFLAPEGWLLEQFAENKVNTESEIRGYSDPIVEERRIRNKKIRDLFDKGAFAESAKSLLDECAAYYPESKEGAEQIWERMVELSDGKISDLDRFILSKLIQSLDTYLNPVNVREIHDQILKRGIAEQIKLLDHYKLSIKQWEVVYDVLQKIDQYDQYNYIRTDEIEKIASVFNRLDDQILGIATQYFVKYLDLPPLSTLKAKTINIFIDYASEDKKYVTEFKNHVKLLIDAKTISVWDDSQVLVGDRWDKAIQEHIFKADVVVVFLSKNYLVSAYLASVTSKLIKKRYANGDIQILPVLIGKCDWVSSEFSNLAFSVSSYLPLEEIEQKNLAWAELSRNISASWTSQPTRICILDNRIYHRLEKYNLVDNNLLLCLEENLDILKNSKTRDFIANCNYVIICVRFVEQWLMITRNISFEKINAKSYDLFLVEVILPLVSKKTQIILTSGRSVNRHLTELLSFIKYEQYESIVKFIPTESIIGVIETHLDSRPFINAYMLNKNLIQIPTISISAPLLSPTSEHELGWQFSDNTEAITEYEKYLKLFPNGLFAEEARLNIKHLKFEEEVWKSSVQFNTINAYENYLSTYPNGRYAEVAKNRIQERPKPSIARGEKAPKVFICYASENRDLLLDFKKRFQEHYGEVELLFDGTPYSGNMHARSRIFAEQCDVAILLINARFTNLESYANKFEIPILLERQKQHEVTVVGTIFSDFDVAEWNRPGDVYFFQMRYGELIRTRRRDENADHFHTQFAVYEFIEKEDRNTYHKELVKFVKEAIGLTAIKRAEFLKSNISRIDESAKPNPEPKTIKSPLQHKSAPKRDTTGNNNLPQENKPSSRKMHTVINSSIDQQIRNYHSKVKTATVAGHVAFLKGMGEQFSEIKGSNFQFSTLSFMEDLLDEMIADIEHERHSKEKIDQLMDTLEELIGLNGALIRAAKKGEDASAEWIKNLRKYIKTLRNL